MDNLPYKGPLKDEQLEIITDAGILVKEDKFEKVGKFNDLEKNALSSKTPIIHLKENFIAVPGYVDNHTHICFGGTRANDFALRNSGATYLEIAAAGGGIWDTVTHTRSASKEELTAGILNRLQKHILNGTTCIEVKSGYGLSVNEELKMLEAIKEASSLTKATIVPTCLAAHIIPKEFKTNPEAYLTKIITELFPLLKSEKLANRIDAFIEEEAYSASMISPYLQRGREMGFDITIHADQFTTIGSDVAIEYGAVSADHLEASGPREIEALAKSNTIPTALPGASLGLGCRFTPARALLDAGCSLAIASDHNPGSAPMGDLVTQSSILATYEKLTTAEVLSGITYRSAKSLNLSNKGKIKQGFTADFNIYKTNNYQDILYYQGHMKPHKVIIKGRPYNPS